MDLNRMQPFLVWASLIQGMAIFWACKRGAIDVAVYCLIVAVIMGWMAFVQYRTENPKPTNPKS